MLPAKCLFPSEPLRVASIRPFNVWANRGTTRRLTALVNQLLESFDALVQISIPACRPHPVTIRKPVTHVTGLCYLASKGRLP
jgi:hypothetical protein